PDLERNEPNSFESTRRFHNEDNRTQLATASTPMHERLEKRRGVTMIYRKLISVLVFAVFGFCFSRAATAQDFSCDNPDFCFDFGIPVTVDNITGSSVSCVLNPGGASDPFNI